MKRTNPLHRDFIFLDFYNSITVSASCTEKAAFLCILRGALNKSCTEYKYLKHTGLLDVKQVALSAVRCAEHKF